MLKATFCSSDCLVLFVDFFQELYFNVADCILIYKPIPPTNRLITDYNQQNNKGV